MCHALLCQEHGSQSKQKKERMCVFAIKDLANSPGAFFFTPTQDMDDEEDYSRCGLGTPHKVDSLPSKNGSNLNSIKCGKGGLGESCRRSVRSSSSNFH